VIVVDASALLEALLRTPAANAVEKWLFDSGLTLHVRHLLDAEVAQVLRRYTLSGDIKKARGRAALADLGAFPLVRYPHDFLLSRMWELRNNLTAYDAVYIALAEALDAPLLTRDRRLAAASEHRARIELVG
jgi:predicted nucleic acid-binding protein